MIRQAMTATAHLAIILATLALVIYVVNIWGMYGFIGSGVLLLWSFLFCFARYS